MKKKTLLILVLTLSALCLTACDGCGKKTDNPSEVPLIVLEDKNTSSEEATSETKKSDDDTSKAKVVIDDKNIQTDTAKKQVTTPATQAEAAAQPQNTQPSDSTWQMQDNQPAPTTPVTPSQTDTKQSTPTPSADDSGIIELPMIPLN